VVQRFSLISSNHLSSKFLISIIKVENRSTVDILFSKVMRAEQWEVTQLRETVAQDDILNIIFLKQVMSDMGFNNDDGSYILFFNKNTSMKLEAYLLRQFIYA